MRLGIMKEPSRSEPITPKPITVSVTLYARSTDRQKRSATTNERSPSTRNTPMPITIWAKRFGALVEGSSRLRLRCRPAEPRFRRPSCAILGIPTPFQYCLHLAVKPFLNGLVLPARFELADQIGSRIQQREIVCRIF